MITKADFSAIDIEVRESVTQVFDAIKNGNRRYLYILLLAEGEYEEELVSSNWLSPYVCSYTLDRMKDESRLTFFSQFMNAAYSFFDGVDQSEDSSLKMHMELMIYTHAWESKPFLKLLYRLAAIVNDLDYPWIVDLPQMGKHEFIRDSIRNLFRDGKMNLANAISKGFHTSLRNAFAHSEYSIELDKKSIELFTFNRKLNWDIPRISFDDWTKRFAYTVFLNIHVLNQMHERRRSIIADLGKDIFDVITPLRHSTKQRSAFRVSRIKYYEKQDTFGFVEGFN